MDEAVELYTPYIDGHTAKKLVKFSESADFSKGFYGGTSKYLPFNDDYGVLYSDAFTRKNIDPEHYKKTMTIIWNLFKDSKKVAPMVGYARDTNGNGIPNPHGFSSKRKSKRDLIFVARAPGITLSDTADCEDLKRKVEQRLNSPQSFYDDIVDTFMSILYETNIKPDFSALNTLFHPVAGFNFCDFNKTIGAKSNGFYDKHLANFLKSFVITNNNIPPRQKKVSFKSEEEKTLYYNTVAKEIRLLANKLYRQGIKEESLQKGIQQIKHLPSLDRL